MVLMHRLKGWSRMRESISRWWNPERVAAFARARHGRPALIAPDGPGALLAAARRGDLNRDALFDFGRRAALRQFKVLGVEVARDGAFPWHADWRWNHEWPHDYFRSYNFYTADKALPYDVRLTWELSRLAFIIPILQNAVLDPEGGWREQVFAVLGDWHQSNPLAHSVNWYPMEAAMRGIVLTCMLDILLTIEGLEPYALKPLLELISEHGAFVWRTVEYTDVRGNHYAAEITALLLCGLALDDAFGEAKQWLSWSIGELPREARSQFLPDGVQIEKSLGYQRLVTELFLIALIALERSGRETDQGLRERIHAACRYTAACRRPDGLAPNIGDNDDARVLNFDPIEPRDHAPLLGVAAGFFNDAALKSRPMSASIPWLLGANGVATWSLLAEQTHQRERHYFQDGGVVIARDQGNFLYFDVGEVGLRGRGGHGHNDLLSFELTLDGRPIIVDPGSYVYTADKEQRNLFRSTAYHNGIRVDGEEIARMNGMWSISAEAVPCDIEVSLDTVATTAVAGHTGYRRLPGPVKHLREVQFDAEHGQLTCSDTIHCSAPHVVERFFHFDPALEVQLHQRGASLITVAGSYRLSWQRGAAARLDPGWISAGYNLKQQAKILTLTNRVATTETLRFSIQSVRRQDTGLHK